MTNNRDELLKIIDGWETFRAGDGNLSIGMKDRRTDEQVVDEILVWLAEHDRAVRVAALTEAAEQLDQGALPGTDATGYYASNDRAGYLEAESHVIVWLRARAGAL